MVQDAVVNGVYIRDQKKRVFAETSPTSDRGGTGDADL